MIQRQRLTRALKRTFREQVKAVMDQYTAHFGKATGDDTSNDWIDWTTVFSLIPLAVQSPLQLSAAEGIASGIDALPAEVSAGVAIGPGFVNDWSVQYAKDRGAEMIGMKWVDGELVDNPDAEWAISGLTRDAINNLVSQSIEDGWTTDKLSQSLQDDYAFSGDRADMIARTETRLADGGGRQAAWQESGVVAQKVWLIGDDDPCPECIENADAGPIDLDDQFPSGDDYEPAHPNCNCVVSPITESGAEE